MWLWWFVSFALASEPELNRTRPSIGVSAQNIVLYGGALAPAVNPTLRLVLRQRALADLTFGAGLERSTMSNGEWEPSTTGDASLRRFDGLERRGPSARLGVRTVWRVHGDEADGVYFGMAAFGSLERLNGPMFEETSEDGEPRSPTEVGALFTQERTLAAGVSIVSVHWLSERVALSGFADAYVAESYASVLRVTRVEAEQPYLNEERTQANGTVGFWPVLGLSIHLLL